MTDETIVQTMILLRNLGEKDETTSLEGEAIGVALECLRKSAAAGSNIKA